MMRKRRIMNMMMMRKKICKDEEKICNNYNKLLPPEVLHY